MLTAYIDESGQDSHEWMSVAGFLGNDDQWKSFFNPWQEAIAPRKRLHLKQLRFNTHRERIRLTLERAAKVPDQCNLQGMFGIVRFADYADLVSGDEELFCGYVACCLPMVLNTLRGIPANERVELVFERQDRYWHILDLALWVVVHFASAATRMSDGTSKLANWRSVEKDTTPLIDVADYLAYALVQHYRDPMSLRARWCSPILKCSGGLGYGRVQTRERSRRIVNRAKTLFQLGDELPRLLTGDPDELKRRILKL